MGVKEPKVRADEENVNSSEEEEESDTSFSSILLLHFPKNQIRLGFLPRK
jgi:hypothetical protein